MSIASPNAWRKDLLLNGALELLRMRSLPPLRIAKVHPLPLLFASAQSWGRETRAIWISPE